MPPRTSIAAPRRLPLVVTADERLLDDLLRLAALAGTDVDLAADPVAARSRQAAAPFVLVGADQADAYLRARMPRRPRLVLVGRADQDQPWQVAELLGAEHVAILPAAEPWLVDRLTDNGGTDKPAAAVIGVIGGRGGAGASVLAGALSVTAARLGLRSLLVDADPLGGGLDLVLGWEQIDGLRWPALADSDGRIDPSALAGALPCRGDLGLLSWDRGEPLPLPAATMTAALDAARRERDVVVVDLPRRPDEAAIAAMHATDRVLVLVPAELRATAATARVITDIQPHCTDLSLVVRGPAPGRLRAREIGRTLGLPVTGVLQPEPRVSRGLERGDAPGSSGRGPLAELCQRVVAGLVDRAAAAS
ncbi:MULTISPECIES: septum site-determining protein Ssd [unclassified Solwaraspora]|uniref:septum site-determining protein Ssd n=1 Tax=unclassified Solwaraspora TaxID=2627926 RepID=UPI00248B5786|nr:MULTISPECIES: septum site-determining protein Ssd [unclassified Solwaraspora]WBB96561.1 CpaE-like family protein [Solwaraspora sp. WMMA2059]WBC19534.1 CpaE-like family protein [Solwaraspora sp. WMMA2080]WJK32882.1 CpaE-like family protein [Solwaraspora sp. WMMA2065]